MKGHSHTLRACHVVTHQSGDRVTHQQMAMCGTSPAPGALMLLPPGRGPSSATRDTQEGPGQTRHISNITSQHFSSPLLCCFCITSLLCAGSFPILSLSVLSISISSCHPPMNSPLWQKRDIWYLFVTTVLIRITRTKMYNNNKSKTQIFNTVYFLLTSFVLKSDLYKLHGLCNSL